MISVKQRSALNAKVIKE